MIAANSEIMPTTTLLSRVIVSLSGVLAARVRPSMPTSIRVPMAAAVNTITGASTPASRWARREVL